jgi:Ca2+-binding EF-hand superfamily protein
VRVEDVVLEVQAGGDGAGRVRGLHAFCRQQFDAAQAGRKDGVSREQAAGSPLLTGLFTQADRDGDGRLTGQELDAFLDLHALGAGGFASLGAADQSLGLFGLLDEDSDSRLSLRELHTAWKRLGGLDRDRDDRVGRDEFPRRLLVRVGRGPLLPRPAGGATGGLTPRRSPGPDWFRRSDRNGDGYVSRREFLGPEEVFRRLDVDRDGLISPDEAKP